MPRFQSYGFLNWMKKTFCVLLLVVFCPAREVLGNPEIVIQPIDAWVEVGKVARFRVEVVGMAPITFVWLRNGVPIPGTDGAEYAEIVAGMASNGLQFRCVVANDSGIDSSQIAILHVTQSLAIPRLLRALDSAPVALGDTAYYRLTAKGTDPLFFSWFKNDALIPGAQDSVFKYGPIVLSDTATEIKGRVTNGAGMVETPPTRIRVTQPASQTLVIQGHLADNQGNVLGISKPDTVDMRIALYAQAKSGTPVYTEWFLKSSNRGIMVHNGKFQVVLGSQPEQLSLPAAVSGAKQLFVSFSLGRNGASPEVLEPRVPFTAAPYALKVGL